MRSSTYEKHTRAAKGSIKYKFECSLCRFSQERNELRLINLIEANNIIAFIGEMLMQKPRLLLQSKLREKSCSS